MLSIYQEAVVFMALCTRCFLSGYLWSSHSRQLGGSCVLPQVMVLEECYFLELFLLCKTLLCCSNSVSHCFILFKTYFDNGSRPLH